MLRSEVVLSPTTKLSAEASQREANRTDVGEGDNQIMALASSFSLSLLLLSTTYVVCYSGIRILASLFGPSSEFDANIG